MLPFYLLLLLLRLPRWLIYLLVPKTQQIWVQSLDQEDPLEKEMATHSSFLAREIPSTEKPGRLQSMGSQMSQIWLSSLTTAAALPSWEASLWSSDERGWDNGHLDLFFRNTLEGPPWQPVVNDPALHSTGCRLAPWLGTWDPTGLTGPEINKNQNHTGAPPCLRLELPGLDLQPHCVQASLLLARSSSVIFLLSASLSQPLFLPVCWTAVLLRLIMRKSYWEVAWGLGGERVCVSQGPWPCDRLWSCVTLGRQIKNVTRQKLKG